MAGLMRALSASFGLAEVIITVAFLEIEPVGVEFRCALIYPAAFRKSSKEAGARRCQRFNLDFIVRSSFLILQHAFPEGRTPHARAARQPQQRLILTKM